MSELQLPPVERVVAYTPRAGDKIVLQISAEDARPEAVLRLKEAAEKYFGLPVCVLGGASFVGVVAEETETA